MADAAMPLVVINMGGEMVYILEQRLRVQNITHDKTARVLHDVLRTMYSPKFIDELFRHQDLYTMAATRQIFDRLAHSSIMRLNESSMDKLFDLMTMGFKQQICACRSPSELVCVTTNHLRELRRLAVASPQICELIDGVSKRVVDRYGGMSTATLLLLKQTLFRFLGGKRIKVSLFLQEGLQRPDGTLVHDAKGALPPGSECPGTITRYDDAGTTVGVDSFSYPNVADVLTATADLQADCKLGQNRYSHDSKVDSLAAAQPSIEASPGAALRRGDSQQVEREILGENGPLRSTHDLNLLADLIGSSASPASGDGAAGFKLNPFPSTFQWVADKAGGVPEVKLDTGAQKELHASNRHLIGIMSEMSMKGETMPDAGGEAGEDDDLLDLLDAAS